MVIFETDVVRINLDGFEYMVLTVTEQSHAGYMDTWTEGSLSIGALLGEDQSGSQFLTGCLEKIQIQGKNLDMDLATKEMSIYSHSCPA
ncbi:hypothetical protein WMY93_014508 [Mugilogobius chulae]|uniref:Uncharacterized protein n=1 Tax=Mugilogobius chulae TaxID=88201 RepID=A0AAW0NVQ8_9GOBI